MNSQLDRKPAASLHDDSRHVDWRYSEQEGGAVTPLWQVCNIPQLHYCPHKCALKTRHTAPDCARSKDLALLRVGNTFLLPPHCLHSRPTQNHPESAFRHVMVRFHILLPVSTIQQAGMCKSIYRRHNPQHTARLDSTTGMSIYSQMTGRTRSCLN